MKNIAIREFTIHVKKMLMIFVVLIEMAFLLYLINISLFPTTQRTSQPEVTLAVHSSKSSSNSLDIAKPNEIPTPTPTPTPIPTAIPTPSPVPVIKANKLCLNYGHQTNDYDLSDLGPVKNDLDKIKSSGISCLRIAYGDWNYSGMLDLAKFAKSNGFRVILGGHYGDVSEDDFSSYRNKVIKQAKWAQANNIDQFSLGNEQEFKLSTSKENWYNFLIDLSAEVDKVYSGVTSYETSGTFFDFWLEKSLGKIDKLGFNMYSGYGTNATRIQEYISIHGANRVYVSETNADLDIKNFRDDVIHAQHVEQNTLPLLELGIPIYYFTYSTCTGTEKYWGLYQCGDFAQPKTANVLGIK